MPATSRPRPAPRGRLALAAALPPLLLALVSCGYGSQAVEGPAKAAPRGPALSAATVRVGYLANLTQATVLVGDREGFLQRELRGTRLRTAVFNAGPSAVEALNAGSVDIAYLGPSPVVNSYTRSGGKSLRIVGGAASGGVRLVVNPDRVKGLADVRGKRIATPQLGNGQDVALLHWAAERGWKVDPRSGKGDVSVLRVDNKVLPDAYRSGAVDGAWAPEPTASKLIAEGAKPLLEEASLWPGGRFPITNIVTSQAFLERHPDVVEAVLRGSVEANAWITAHPERAKAAANAQVEALTGKALPDGVLDSAWPTLRFLDDPLAGTLREQARRAEAVGLLEAPRLDGVYDLRPLNRVLAERGRTPVPDAGLGVR
ncbi:ABC transporter substrate-binding protein [Streptomyces somaliensis]|uniref:ABC transporter substrate-binding protein n=1 Tax=Streptomyces somaliensis (strain ATCC 33201 / DSM 40738 / JCM 12659 / KCTC 9044 / NCTC 11332 / NRRL B-12077 / IP 733) TaxID=1134445 RepID=A0AA44DH31_STRE0|nr:ABC transporter substrate-binding protein [Streptomyces somaliensis]NKY16001.1 ABC transporter substrate-binding protein [Streptomyces somaliensis DSM 40738]